MTPTLRTLDDFRTALAGLPGPDAEAAAKAAAREPQLTKPTGALGRLEEIAAWLSAWQGRHPPRVETVAARVFAGNHGVAARGVSAFPAAVTAQMVANFEAGGAAVNQVCRAAGASLEVRALDLDRPTADFTAEAAMTEAEAVEALNAGFESVGDDVDLVCLGEMGIANTTAASALAMALYGGSAADWTGPGTGVAGGALVAKTAIVGEAVARHAAETVDAVDTLRRLGGRELAAIAGAVVAARLRRVPVLLDGFVCTAAAAPLEAYRPGALDHCLVAHTSAEPGHRRLAEALGKAPLFDLGMRLGEASGAVLAAAVVRAAAVCHADMATFADAGVAEGEA